MRTPGFDIARALAVLGMVLVNFRGALRVGDHGTPALVWLADHFEGKAGALFVLLAGVGISLRTHPGGGDPTADRRALFDRAMILLGMGLLLMHLWEWDILHFHAVYLLLAIPLLRAPTVTLWLLAAASVWITMLLGHELDWNLRPSLTTLDGATRHVVFNGLYPVFPWFAFVLVGMAVGRLDLTDAAVRRRTFAIALAIVIMTEAVDALGRYEQQTGTLGLGGHAGLLLTWPRAPRPLFVVSGSAIAVATICACITITGRRGDRRWVIALVATGQLAFTLYIAHVIAVLLPMQHGWLVGVGIEVAFAYGLAFFAAAVAFALWWRRRWEYGPFEGVIRQVTGRDRLEPWGGTQLRGREPHRDAPPLDR